MSESPLIIKRPAQRRGTWTPAVVAIGDWCCDARVRNVSRFGALLESASAPRIDTAITIACAGLALAARVMWRDDERFGVAFDVPLLPAQLRTLANEGLRVAAPPGYRRESATAPALRAVGD